MAKNNNLGDFLTDVANAIRAKKGTTDRINAQNFSSEIASIPSQKPEQSKTLNVNSNDSYIVTPDTGKVLNRVDVTVEVPTPTIDFKIVGPNDLDFSAGDVNNIHPDSGVDALSYIKIEKPTNLSPENIKSGVSIAGVDGSYEASGGGGGGELVSFPITFYMPHQGITVTTNEVCANIAGLLQTLIDKNKIKLYGLREGSTLLDTSFEEISPSELSLWSNGDYLNVLYPTAIGESNAYRYYIMGFSPVAIKFIGNIDMIDFVSDGAAPVAFYENGIGRQIMLYILNGVFQYNDPSMPMRINTNQAINFVIHEF